MDYFLLSGVAAARRIDRSRVRILLAAALGAIYSCLAFFSSLGFLFTAAGKIIVSALMTAVAYKIRGLRPFMLSFICLHAASALLAGLVAGIELLFSPSALSVQNGEFYINISALFLVAVCAAAYFFMLAVTRILKPRRKGEICRVTVTVDGARASFFALTDSGNLLTDPLTGAYVLIASLSAVKDLLPSGVQAALTGVGDFPESWKTRVSLVPYKTVSGGGLLPAFRPDSLTVDGKPAEKRVLIAVKENAFTDEYDAVIGANI